MQIKEIKNINKISLAKTMALIYGFVGFFTALALAISTMANIVIKKDFSGSFILVILFSVGGSLLLGILSSLVTALTGWVIGYITAGIYNWFAVKAGGIKIELVDGVNEARRADKIEEVSNNLF